MKKNDQQLIKGEKIDDFWKKLMIFEKIVKKKWPKLKKITKLSKLLLKNWGNLTNNGIFCVFF